MQIFDNLSIGVDLINGNSFTTNLSEVKDLDFDNTNNLIFFVKPSENGRFIMTGVSNISEQLPVERDIQTAADLNTNFEESREVPITTEKDEFQETKRKEETL